MEQAKHITIMITEDIKKMSANELRSSLEEEKKKSGSTHDLRERFSRAR
jgi:hypothetical protein